MLIQKTIRKKPRVTGLRRSRCVAIPVSISLSSHEGFPSPMWIPTLLGPVWVKPILRYSHGNGLGMIDRYFRYLPQSLIWPFCQSWMGQSLVCQTPAGISKSFRNAGRSLMEMVVHTPVMLRQSSITILLLDGSTQRWNYKTQRWFVLFIVANKPTAQLVPRYLCVVAAVIFLGMSPSHLQPRIWSMIVGRNRMMRVRRGARIHEASDQRNQASESLKWGFNRGVPDRGNTLKSPETMLLVPLPITCNASLLMRMWLGYTSRITFWIIPLQAL